MAEKGFGVKEINLIGASGTPTIESPNNLNLNAVNVAISTNVSIGGTLTVTGNISAGGTVTYEDVTNVDSIGIITARQGVRINADSINPAGASATNYLSVGASQDLKLYHNGNQNYITAPDGTILIQADNIMLVSDDTSGRSLYQDNANSRLELGFDGTAAAYVSSSNVQFVKPITANTDGQHDIGTNSVRFRNAYVDTYYGSGANLTGIAVTEAPVVDYTITSNSSSAYRFHGGGVDETADDPDLYLIRGQKYRFNNTTGSGHPFRFSHTGNANAAYSNGVTGSEGGVQFWTIPYDAPSKLFYVCTLHPAMVGNIYIRGANGQNDNVGITTFADNVRLSNASKNLTVDGQILIGTTSGSEKLIVKRDDTTGPTISLTNNANTAYINNWGSVGGGSGRTNRFEINAESQGQASICAPYITFMIGGTGDSNEKIRITSDGNLKISQANKGIDFTAQTVGSVSGVSVASELLDHYEEGTFVPFISATSSAPSVTYSGSERGAKYTRIGNIVFYSLGFQMSAYSGGSGNVYIGGFPYVGTGNPGWDGAHVFRDCSAIGLNSRTNQLGGWMEVSAVSGYPILYIQVHSNTTSFAADSLGASSVQAGRITIHGHYKIG